MRQGWKDESRALPADFPYFYSHSHFKPEMHGNREWGGADGERIAAAKTKSTSSTFKKDIFTVLNWEFRLEILSVSTSLHWQITAFSNSFYRFICKKSAVFSCLLETTCMLVFSERRDCGDWDWKKCFIVCSQSLSFFPSHTYCFSFSSLPYLWRKYFQMCTFSVLSECSLD